MRFEELGHLHGIFLRPVDADAHCFNTATGQEGLVRIHIATHGDHDGTQFFVVSLSFCNNHPAHDIGMAVDKFGQGVKHDVGAHVERILKVWAAEGIVDANRDVVLMCYLTNGGNIGDPDGGIGWCFKVNQRRVGTDGCSDLFKIGGIDVGRFNSKFGESSFNDPAGRTIHGIVT